MNLETNRLVHEVVIDDRGAVRGAQGVENALDKAAAATARLDKAAGDAGGKLQAVGSAAASAAKGVGSAASATLDAAAGIAVFASETLTAERAWTALELTVATATGGIGGLKREIAETVVETKLFREQASEAAKAWSTLKRAAAGIGIGLSIGGLISEAQEYTRAQNLLAQSVEGSSALIERSVYSIAQAAGASFTGLAGLTKALDELPGGARKSLDVVEGVALSMAKIPGNAQSSGAAITQFTQAMQSGVLRGDEFNSMMEQAPPLADALAKGLGRARGELRGMAEDGKLTAERVADALSSMLPELRKFNQESERAFSQWVQIVDNAFGQFSANVDQRAGASAKLGESLGGVAERLESIQAQNAAVAVLEKLSSVAGIAADAIFLMADNLDLVIGAWVAWQALKAATGMGLFASAVKNAAWAIEGLETVTGRALPRAAKHITSLGAAAAFSVSPITILLTAVQAVGVGLLLYQSRVTDAQRASELQAQTMDLVADGMAKARRETDSTANAMAALAKASAAEAMVRAQENLSAQTEELRDRVDAVSHSLFVMTNNRLPALANMRTGVKEIMAEFAAGRIDVDGVGEALANLVAENENWRSKAGTSFEAISSWREQNEVVSKANALIAVLSGTATAAEIALLGLGDGAGKSSGSVNKFVTDLRAEAALIGKVGVAREIAINLRKAETVATTELGREVIKLTTALAGEENLRGLRGQNDRLALARAELELVGEGQAARTKELAVLQKHLDLKERGVDLTSTQALEELRLAKAIADVNEKTSDARVTQGLERRVTLAKAELGLVGEGEAARDKALAVLQKQLDLKERGVALTSAQALEEIRLAQSIAETATATSNATKLQGLRENLQLMKSEIQLAGQGAAIREAGVAVLQKQLELRRRGVDLTSEQAREELRLVGAIAEASTQINNIQALRGLQESLKIAEAELALIGETASIRESQLEILKKELDLKRRGVGLTSEQAREELRLTENIQSAKVALERQRENVGVLRGVFTDLSSAVSDFATGVAQGATNMRDLGNVGEAILTKLIQRFGELAILNPLQNFFFGDGLPTIGSVASTAAARIGIAAPALGGGGASIFGASQPFTGAASFGSQMFTGGLASPLVFSQTGASLGLSQAIPGAANGAIASGSGVAPTAMGAGLMQMSSLAVLPFLGMGIAALASIAMKKDLPRSAAQIGVQDGMFGVDAVHTLNGGDPAVGQAIGEAASGIANAFLEASGARLAAGAQLGMIGLDQKWIGTTTSSGLYDHSMSDQLGVRGLTKDNRTFEKSEAGQRAATADFATRNLLNQLLEGSITGLTDTAAETIKFGLGNLARNIESTMSEIDFEAFSRQFEMLAGWDALRDEMQGLDEVAGDTARRLEKASASQSAFNERVSAFRAEADAALAESGSGLNNIGTFVDDAMALFDPTGGNRFQLRLQLGEGAGTGSIDGNGTAYTVPGENGIRPTLTDLFGFGTQTGGEGSGAALQNQLIVFDELIETIDQNLGENGRLIEAFHKSGDNLDFSISKLADILEERGVELQPILDDFFDLDISRERMSEIGDMAKFKVDQFFDSITDAAASFGGSRTLFEDIVPAISPIVEQFETMKAQIEATRPDLLALNEDLAALGEAAIDVNGKIADATASVAEQAQNQFLADLGIAVDRDGNISSANVDFSAISQAAQWTKGADENARVLFESDPRNLLPDVTAEINQRTEQRLNELLAAADDYNATLEQINMIFGDRIADFDLIAEGQNAQLVDQAALARATFAAQQALMEQQRERLGILQEEASVLEGVANAANDNFRTLSQASRGLLTNSNLSTLSAGERVAEASRQLEAAYALANDNDPMDAESQAAINNLPSLVNTQLELSRAYNASSEAYQEDFARGQEILNKTASNQNSIAQQQLSTLEGIHSEMESLNAALSAASKGATYVKGGDGQYVTTGLNGVAAGIDLGYDAETNLRIYKAFSAAGINYTGAGEGQIGAQRSNPTVDAILTAMGFANGGVFHAGNVIPFANGTVINQPTLFPMGGNQRGLMGEAGPEAIMPLARIGGRLGVVASGGNSNRELLRELAMLREEVRMLRAERREDSRRQTAVTAQGALEVRRAVTDGNQTQGRMAEAAERAAAAPKGKAA